MKKLLNNMEKVQDRMQSAAAALRKSQYSKSKGSESDSAFYQNSIDGDDQQQQKLDLDDYIKTTEYKSPVPENASTPILSTL